MRCYQTQNSNDKKRCVTPRARGLGRLDSSCPLQQEIVKEGLFLVFEVNFPRDFCFPPMTRMYPNRTLYQGTQSGNPIFQRMIIIIGLVAERRRKRKQLRHYRKGSNPEFPETGNPKGGKVKKERKEVRWLLLPLSSHH